jgi:hypothetical protein
LEVDWSRLVRPPSTNDATLAVAERIVRACCVGESLTVAVLLAAKQTAKPKVIADVLARIVRDEAEHAELGWTFLDWVSERLSDADRAHLAASAAHAIASFAPLFSAACDDHGAMGVMSCAEFDPVFDKALQTRVLVPLAARDIVVSSS